MHLEQCLDEFLPIDDVKFFVSMMCNDNVVSPNDTVLIDIKTCSTNLMLKMATVRHFNMLMQCI